MNTSKREALREIVEGTETRAGRLFDFVIQGLIVLSLVAFSLDTLPDNSESMKKTLAIIELVTILIFTAEYLLRLYVAERRMAFVFSFYGIIDLLVIAPFYIPTGLDLRGLRAIRMLRLFKLFRYSKAIHRFKIAFQLVKDELVLFGGAALVLMYIAAAGIYVFENEAQPEVFKSVFHSLWWAVATLTTVGYGEIYPITIGGKIFTFFVLAVGLGVIAVPTGLMATALAQTRQLPAPPKDAESPDKKQIEIEKQNPSG